MSFATVYNNLEALKERGRVLHLKFDSERMRYDPNTSEHHHMICDGCKKIIDVNVDFDLRIPEDLKHDFEISRNHIMFHGTCADCRQRGESTSKREV